MQSDDDEQLNAFKQIGALMTIPFVLAVPPIVGWFIGSHLDSYFGTSPKIMIVLMILGIAAGFKETYRLIRRFGNGQ